MATVTKKELIDRIAGRTQAKRATVKEIIQAFLVSPVSVVGCEPSDRLFKVTGLLVVFKEKTVFQ